LRGMLAPAGSCATRQVVTVFRSKPGRDARIRVARTNATDRFVIRTTAAPGRYYATTRATIVATAGNCLEATSKRLKVRRSR
jgi:hypothetical protein